MSGTHAPLACSAANEWGNCSGSYRANLGKPDLDTPESLEGDASHWLGSEVLQNYRTPGRGSVKPLDFLNQTAPNGVIIDDKIVEGIQIYVNDIIETADKYNAVSALLIEHRVTVPTVHPTDNWGTLDCALYLPAHGVLYLWDYKHGHRLNDAKENKQLINYVEGLKNLFEINGLAEQNLKVVMRIIRPFCYQADGPISEWSVQLSELRPYINGLHHKAHEALSDNPTLSSGPWCRDCTAVGRCSAARTLGYNLINLVDSPYQMDEMNSNDLATERDIIKNALVTAQARLEAIEDELHARITRGDSGGGLTLEASYGRLEWTCSVPAAIALAKQFGLDASKDSVLTPTQTKNAIDKNMRSAFESILPPVTRRPPGKIKLVQAGDSRVAKAFKPKTE